MERALDHLTGSVRPQVVQGSAIEGALNLLSPIGSAASIILCAALGNTPALFWVRKIGRIQSQKIAFVCLFVFTRYMLFILINRGHKTFLFHMSSLRWPPCRLTQANSATVLESLFQTEAGCEPPQNSLEWWHGSQKGPHATTQSKNISNP